MSAKKERELFATALERHLKKENEMLEEYRALSELLEGIPPGILLDWIITEEVLHHTLLSTMIKTLKQASEKKKGNGADGLGMERDKVLYWTEKLLMKEQAVAANCRYLKSQVSRKKEDVLEALLDAMIMNSEKHQRLILAVEKIAKA